VQIAGAKGLTHPASMCYLSRTMKTDLAFYFFAYYFSGSRRMPLLAPE
jgi:hypothetical protein